MSQRPNFEAPWNPVAAEAAQTEGKFCTPGEFNQRAKSCLEVFNADDFRVLCRTAIHEGIISQQDFETRFGENNIPRNPEKDLSDWNIPAPNIVRDILCLFSTIDTTQISGNKLPWQHAQSHLSAAEPVAQALQHREAVHLPRRHV
ncbi:MAG: hypothetical protein R3D88_07950 [Alphaproteobacteria bacterium]|nr:hypothetical protein [Alphaproteobacteria bacterium]